MIAVAITYVLNYMKILILVYELSQTASSFICPRHTHSSMILVAFACPRQGHRVIAFIRFIR